MPKCPGILAIVCTGFAFAGAYVAQAQEATSANLPDQFQTGEMIQIQKSKKKKVDSTSQIAATAPEQNTAPVPEQMPTAEEPATPIVAAEQKKAEPSGGPASQPATQKLAPQTQQASSAEESAALVEPVEKKMRAKTRPRSAIQPQTVTMSAPVPMSLSVAQSMAITAPLPEYTYEAKRRNLTGSGVCVVTVDTATGTVTDARMFQTTGSAILDKLTTQTFKSWRFKPGAVSQVRVPISYE